MTRSTFPILLAVLLIGITNITTAQQIAPRKTVAILEPYVAHNNPGLKKSVLKEIEASLVSHDLDYFIIHHDIPSESVPKDAIFKAHGISNERRPFDALLVVISQFHIDSETDFFNSIGGFNTPAGYIPGSSIQKFVSIPQVEMRLYDSLGQVINVVSKRGKKRKQIESLMNITGEGSREILTAMLPKPPRSMPDHRIEIGVKTGVSMSLMVLYNQGSVEPPNPSLSVQTGVTGTFHLTRWLSLRGEAFYFSERYQMKWPVPTDDQTLHLEPLTLNRNSLGIPLLLQIVPTRNFSLYCGPTAYPLVSQKESLTETNIQSSSTLSPAITMGCNVSILDRFEIDARYVQGQNNDLLKHLPSKTYSIQASVGYRFWRK